MRSKPDKPRETFKVSKKGVYSWARPRVTNYSFFAWIESEYIWLSLKHNKTETYKNRILIKDIPSHRYDAHVYFFNLFGVFNESAQQKDNVAFLARLAEALHLLAEECLTKGAGFIVEEPNPGNYDYAKNGRAKQDLGFKVYKQSGKFNPLTHQYEYPEHLDHNPEFKGYESMNDVELGEKLKKAIMQFAYTKAMTDDKFLAECLAAYVPHV